MATQQTISLGKKYLQFFKEPVLEIGSKFWPEYIQYSPRDLHNENTDYIGIDIEEGSGVDRILDLSSKKTNVKKLGWEEKFNTIHCHCVLEHITDIFTFSKNLDRVLKKGGRLFITIPFSWKIHRLPIDMWRFTPQSIDYLFPNIFFNKEDCFYSTRKSGDLIPVDSGPRELHLGSKLIDNGILIFLVIKLLKKFNLDKNFFNERALLLENNLMMIGQKSQSNQYTFLPEKYS